ncbi:MAG TPA: tetratricopeptide repeat protein [Blastocatellia bacterium]|nr:tetratricopeptide repeat protein [Blastocatellia bacterium]
MSNGVQPAQAAVLLESPPQTKAMAAMLSRRVALMIVLGLTFLVYAETTRYQFTYDDRGQIVENHALQSWSYAPRCFTEHVWKAQHPDENGVYYRPLFNLYLLVNYQLFHLNPAGWHLLLVIWHTLVTLLVFWLARRLLKDETGALIAALIFGLHPVHIESVAWISGVTEPMLAIFFLGSLLGYLRWRDGEAKWLAASLGLYALALFSKETALVMPALIFGYEWLFGERTGRVARSLKRAAPFLAMAAVFFVLRAIILKAVSVSMWQLPLPVMLMTVPSVLWFYLRLLVWPTGLSAFYDTPYVARPDANLWLIGAALVVIAALLCLWARKSKPVAFAVGLLILPILPVLNLTVFIEKEIAHDRYLYIPSIGFAILVAVGLRKLRLDQLKVAAPLVVVLVLATLTVMQNTYWTNDLQLFARGVVTAPQNDIALTDFANELFSRGRLEEAMPIYVTVTERNPTYWRASFNLGSCYFRQGDNEMAMKYRARAKVMKTLMDDRTGRTAFVRMRLERFDEAEAIFTRAMAEHPDVPEYEYGLGVVRKERGDLAGALAAFKASTVGNPDPLPAETQIAEIQARLK